MWLCGRARTAEVERNAGSCKIQDAAAAGRFIDILEAAGIRIGDIAKGRVVGGV